LHDLRHGVCTMLAEQGVAPELISQLAGHATVGFTLTRYTHPSVDRLSEVGDALDRAFGS
jgi:site-specific recombinase XerD